MSPLGFGIIGCGKIAVKHGQALGEVAGARLVAVCDTVPDRASAFAAQYGGRPYTRAEDLVADPAVEVVIVATPSGLHAPLAILAAAAGKHLLVEKPLALITADCLAVAKAARQAGVRLGVVHPNRFLPTVAALRQAVSNGAFGQLTHGAATVRWHRGQDYYDQAAWRGTVAMDGGVLFNQAIHNIDLLQWIFGPVETVQGTVATQLRRIEAEDLGAAVVRFASGAVGVIEASATVFPENLEETLAVFGSHGTAVLGGRSIGGGVRAWRFAAGGPEPPAVEPVPPHWGQRAVIADMVRAIETGEQPAVSGTEALRAIAIIQAIYESNRTGRSVRPAQVEECWT